jgi:hypothetical protein
MLLREERYPKEALTISTTSGTQAADEDEREEEENSLEE